MFERLKTKAASAGAYYTMVSCQQHLHKEIGAESVEPPYPWHFYLDILTLYQPEGGES